MPEREHAAHGHVHPALGALVVVPAVLQQRQHLRLHGHRFLSGAVVDLLQSPGPVVVDVEDPVVLDQRLVHLLRPPIKSLLRCFIPPQGGDGIEHIQKNRLVHLLFRFCAAAEQRKQKQRKK